MDERIDYRAAPFRTVTRVGLNRQTPRRASGSAQVKGAPDFPDTTVRVVFADDDECTKGRW